MNVWHTTGKRQVTRKTRGVCDEDSLVETKTGSKLFCYLFLNIYVHVCLAYYRQEAGNS